MSVFNIARTVVNDCVLRLTDKNISVPVAKFTLQFELNAIPTLEITPAFGRNIRDNTRATLQDVEEEDAAALMLQLNGENKLLFAGFVSSVSADDNSTIFTRKLSARIKVEHRMVRLAGAPAASFVYTGRSAASLTTLSDLKLVSPLYNTDGLGISGDKRSLVPASDFIGQYRDIEGEQAPFYSSLLLQYITRKLLGSFNPLYTDDELQDLIRDYCPANLTRIIPEPDAYMEQVSARFSEYWRTENTWQALVGTAKHLYMAMVPFNTGFYVANPFALDRQPAKVIRAADFINNKQTSNGNLAEPVNGVVIASPTNAEENFTFPDILAPDETTARLANRYYHYRKFPDWLQPMVKYMYGASTPGSVYYPKPVPNFSNSGAQGIAEYFQQVGVRIAKTIYSQMKQRQATIQLMFPYRDDLMPGTVVSVATGGQDDISFLGDTLYGMIARTVVVCDITQEDSPALNTYVDITGVRNSEDNANDNITFDGHPLYEGRWVGVDMFGEFLSDPPECAGPDSTQGLVNFNSTEGTSKPVEAEETAEEAAAARRVGNQRLVQDGVETLADFDGRAFTSVGGSYADGVEVGTEVAREAGLGRFIDAESRRQQGAEVRVFVDSSGNILLAYTAYNELHDRYYTATTEFNTDIEAARVLYERIQSEVIQL